jgi:hypothetical protein
MAMKLLELYINKNAPHRFICVDGVRRSDLPFTNGDTNVMLAEAVRIIEGDEAFEERIRIYDAHGIATPTASGFETTGTKTDVKTATTATLSRCNRRRRCTLCR